MNFYYILILLSALNKAVDLKKAKAKAKATPKPCHDLIKCAEIRINNCECGTVLGSRIVGGEVTKKSEFPWQAAIALKSANPRCGGVLVSDLHVITAAHCLVGLEKKVGDIRVYLGLYDYLAKTSAYKGKAKTIAVHARFDSSKGMNDIGVIALRKPAPLSDKIIPICFPPPGRNYVGLKATVVGWGRIYHKGPKSATLLKVEIPIRDEPLCYWKIKEKHKVPSQLCAYYDEGLKDSCEGDSGSPMMIKNKTHWYLIGIVVMGWGCAQPKTPAIYTRVDYFYHWIDKHIKEGIFCSV